MPSSATSLLELRLGEWGYDAMGFVAHVPHYVAQGDYPAASAKLLESLEVVTGLEWDLETLADKARVRADEIAEQVRDSPEVADVVAGLEQQYDTFARSEERRRRTAAGRGGAGAPHRRGAGGGVRAVPRRASTPTTESDRLDHPSSIGARRRRPSPTSQTHRQGTRCPPPPTSSSSCWTSRPST